MSCSSGGVGKYDGAAANMVDYDIVVSEFKLESCYYVYFSINTLGKCIDPLISPGMG